MPGYQLDIILDSDVTTQPEIPQFIFVSNG